MRTKIGFIIVLILLVLGYYLWWPKTYAIELRADGFYPEIITIPAGSTVVFRSTTERAFWPASNFHPFHKLYPGFDAGEPISKHQTWEFRFLAPGIWRYHDHLDSRNTATIVVRDSPWAADNPCLAEACFIQEIERELSKKGLDSALALFSRLYETNPSFSSDCHDVTHLLGEAAYRAYAKDGFVVASEKTAYCGYGFYHGFIEAMLFTTGDFEQAKSYCRAVQMKLSETIVSPNAIYSCYHGLGHGTFDTLSFSKWGDDEGMLNEGLATCERVTIGDEAELVKQCASGVFNALANAYNNTTYNLDFNPDNPWGICEKQQNIEYKKACFREVAASYIKEREDIEKAIDIIENISDSVGANATMYAYMGEEARLNLATAPETWTRLCQSVRVDLQVYCVEGVATGLFLWGTPGKEHEKAIAFCNSAILTTRNKDACYAYVLPRIRTVYDQQKVETVCTGIDPDYQRYCQ